MKILLAVVLALSAAAATAVQTEDAQWFKSVSPLMTNAEQSAYRKLSASERTRFQVSFWATKTISKDEYFERLNFIDANFGSSQQGSGINTDQGRVYLSLGPPDRITRIPSSRVFVPLEIWYYRSALNLGTELQLLFYQKNSIGLPRLYSPTLDTIRALLVNEAGTRSMFGPNDSITEADVRNKLSVGPAEDDVFSAAVTVARGVKGIGSEEIISQITQPAAALARRYHEQIRSRIVASRPPLVVLQTNSPFGGVQVDLSAFLAPARTIGLEVLQSGTLVMSDRLEVGTADQRVFQYLYRLDLLPGTYTIVLSVDGSQFAYPITVAASEQAELQRFEPRMAPEHSAPFVFKSQQLVPCATGSVVAIPLRRPGKVQWRIRKGFEIAWQKELQSEEIAALDVKGLSLPPGQYELEAVTSDSESAVMPLSLPISENKALPVVSVNANLTTDRRTAKIAHQHLLRGDLASARRSLDSVQSHAPLVEVERARLEALQGELDTARTRLNAVLASNRTNFDALTVMAFIESEFQDYSVAADFYRRALAVQDSPQLREALAKLPNQQ